MNIIPQRQVHLDFHTSGCIDGIGLMFDAEQFKSCLKKGHVNSITVFAKCHHGWAYFPSEANQMHPGLKFDLLSSMLKACDEIGVQAPVYISAGLDEKYFVEHPDQIVLASPDAKYPEIIEKDGVKCSAEPIPNYHRICMNSPYLDVLVKQTEEVVRKFRPVGIFLDIVGETDCYCKYCRAEAERLGMDTEDPKTYKKLGRITYKKYYTAINNAARAIKPDIRIFHNSGHIPCGRRDLAEAHTHLELESLPTGGWGYDHFPKSARYVSCLGKEYLGMTGKFHLTWGEFGGFKHPNALRYEVALSLANGAKCSVGDQMHPYGFLDDATYELIGKAYSEAERVEEYCYEVESVADIGLLSAEAMVEGLGKTPSCDVGACRMLLEGKYLYDVLDQECDFGKYKLIILPDIIKLTPELTDKLRRFVDGGGKLLCTGLSGTDENDALVFDLGVKIRGKSEFRPAYYHPNYDALGLTPSSYVIYSQMYDTELGDGEVLGYSRNTFFNRAPEHFCSHKHTPYVMQDNSPAVVIGRQGGYIAFNAFTEYAEVGSYILKDTVLRVIDRLLGSEKTLKTNLPSCGVVTLNRQSGKNRDVLHMLYASPIKRGSGVEVIEELLPIYGTELEIKTSEVKGVKLVPQNRDIPYEYRDGVLRFKVDEFSCSQIAIIQH